MFWGIFSHKIMVHTTSRCIYVIYLIIQQHGLRKEPIPKSMSIPCFYTVSLNGLSSTLMLLSKIYYSETTNVFLKSLIALTKSSSLGKSFVVTMWFISSLLLCSNHVKYSSSKRVISVTGISSKNPRVSA
jgi:hypothetical protein